MHSHTWERNAQVKRIEYKKKELDCLRNNQIEKKTTLAELHMKRQEISLPKNKFSPNKSLNNNTPVKNEIADNEENDILRAFPDLNTLQVKLYN